MLSDETAGLEEVAAALGRKPEWLRRNWLKLHQQEGFPRKIAAGWVWPRRSVLSWLRSGGFVQPVAANQNAAEFDPVMAAAASLMERYGARQ